MEKTELKERDIVKIQLNFKELEEWKESDNDDLPVRSFISLYKACGLLPHIEGYLKENDKKQVAPVDNLLCSFYTIQHLKNFLENQWACYSIDIDADNHVFWNTKTYAKGQKHYKRALKKRVKASLSVDFANYCPGLDEELEDDVIVFRVYEPEENVELDSQLEN